MTMWALFYRATLCWARLEDLLFLAGKVNDNTFMANFDNLLGNLKIKIF